MAERLKGHEHVLGAIAVHHPDRPRDRERTTRMLKRIADTLGRPVEDFFKTSATDSTDSTDKTDSATRR